MKFTAVSVLSLFAISAFAADQATPITDPAQAKVFNMENAPAAPTADAIEVSKRQAPETVILSNCDPSSTYGSYVLYYQAGHDANGAPDDQCRVQAGFVTWEGRQVSCRFSSSGVNFNSTINAGAQNQPDFAVVGSGYNGFRTFTCRKDNKRVNWSGSGFSCKSIYYCQ